MCLIVRGLRFIKYNEHKSETLKAYILSAYFRYQMLYENTKKLKRKWGVAGEESSYDLTDDEYRYAKKVAYAVNQVCNKTRWESKCLVRALTAQRLLAQRGIDSTMYLGCKEDENRKMIAHAWIRCGKAFVTGGNGTADGYAVVEKFRAGINR